MDKTCTNWNSFFLGNCMENDKRNYVDQYLKYNLIVPQKIFPFYCFLLRLNIPYQLVEFSQWRVSPQLICGDKCFSAVNLLLILKGNVLISRSLELILAQIFKPYIIITLFITLYLSRIIWTVYILLCRRYEPNKIL